MQVNQQDCERLLKDGLDISLSFPKTVSLNLIGIQSLIIYLCIKTFKF